jgi:hypothetical protein
MCNYNCIFNGIDNNFIGVLGKVPAIKYLDVGDERSYYYIWNERSINHKMIHNLTVK